MARLGLRVRALSWVMRTVPGASIASMSDEQVATAQQRSTGHNRAADAIFGSVAPGVLLSDRSIPGEGGHELPVRIYRPAGSTGLLPVVLNFHGGGWTLGSLDACDWMCSRVSAQVGAMVVSVAYRLAPAHRFPAAVNDAYASLVWVAEHGAELQADIGRIAVMGDSAGANLAAVVSLLARDRSGPAIVQQSLVYPATDFTLSGASMRTNRSAPVLSHDEMVAFRRHYLGDQDAQRDPLASPLFASDHHDLPPALIQVAEHDPLRDDGIRYAGKLRAAGVPVVLTEYAGMPHGFMSLPGVVRGVARPLAELTTALSTALSARSTPDEEPSA